ARLRTLRLSGRPTALSWSPEGRRLAAGGSDGALRVWDIDQVRVVSRPLTALPLGPGLLRPSPDNKALLWVPPLGPGDPGEMPRLLDGATGRTLAVLRDDAGAGASVGWSSDGKRVAAGYNSGLIRLWDPDTGQLVRTLAGHDQAVAYEAWSADNKRMASAG